LINIGEGAVLLGAIIGLIVLLIMLLGTVI